MNKIRFGEVVGFDLQKKVVLIACGNLSDGEPIVNAVPLNDGQIDRLRSVIHYIIGNFTAKL